jgi:hypothetical protein
MRQIICGEDGADANIDLVQLVGRNQRFDWGRSHLPLIGERAICRMLSELAGIVDGKRQKNSAEAALKRRMLPNPGKKR